MNVNKYFESYRIMYNSFDSFHKGGLKTYKYITYLFFLLSKLKFLFRIKNPNIQFEFNIIEVIFSKNQLKCSNALEVNNSSKLLCGVRSFKKNETYISDLILLKLSLKFSKEIYNTLKMIKSDVLLKKNSFRVIKLVVLEEIFKSINFNSVKTIIQYNDHSPYNLMTFEYFKSIGIKTVYCQHAPVSYKFPRLYHDLNLLFSEDSKEKYEKKGSSSKELMIIGDIRFWNIMVKKKNTNKKNKTIALICFNKLDCVNSVKECANFLNFNNIDVIIRKHPRDDIQIEDNEHTSISTNTDIFDDLALCDIAITNESAIPLESIFLDIPTYIFRFKPRKGTGPVFDNYSFMKKGLIKQDFILFENLLKAILNSELVYNKNKLHHFIGPVLQKKDILKKIKTKL